VLVVRGGRTRRAALTRALAALAAVNATVAGTVLNHVPKGTRAVPPPPPTVVTLPDAEPEPDPVRDTEDGALARMLGAPPPSSLIRRQVVSRARN